MPIILAIQKAEIWRITVWGQPGQKVHKIPFQLIKSWGQWHTCHPSYAGSLGTHIRVTKRAKRTGCVAQVVEQVQGPEFKPQNCQKKKKKILVNGFDDKTSRYFLLLLLSSVNTVHAIFGLFYLFCCISMAVTRCILNWYVLLVNSFILSLLSTFYVPDTMLGILMVSKY
jgi:hypothetical protein